MLDPEGRGKDKLGQKEDSDADEPFSPEDGPEEEGEEEWQGFSDSPEDAEEPTTMAQDDTASAASEEPAPEVVDEPKTKKLKQKKPKAEKVPTKTEGDDVNPFALLEEDDDGIVAACDS